MWSPLVIRKFHLLGVASHTLAIGLGLFFLSACDLSTQITPLSRSLTENASSGASSAGVTLTGLSNDASPTRSKVWNWGCSQVCTYRYVVDTSSGTLPAGAYSATTTVTQATGDGTYYLHIQAKDSDGNLSSVSHVSVLMDNTSPTTPGVVTDGVGLSNLAASPAISWIASTDLNGIDHYEYAIGTTSGGTQTLAWTAGTTALTTTFTGLTLANGSTYYFSVRAYDAAGNVSGVRTGDGWVADTTLPGAPTGVIFAAPAHTVTATPALSWTAPADASGIDHYEVQLYLSSDDSIVQTWTTLASGGVLTGLVLSTSADYYAKVRAIDGAGNVGTSYGTSGTFRPINPDPESFTESCGFYNNQSGMLGSVSAPGRVNPANTIALIRKSAGTHDYLCAGVIINANTILTSAHCVDGYAPATLIVDVGEVDTGAASGDEQRYSVAAISMHPSYSTVTHDSDLALVEVGSPGTVEIDFVGLGAKPVNIAANSSTITGGSSVTAFSWHGASALGCRQWLQQLGTVSSTTISSAELDAYYSMAYGSSFLGTDNSAMGSAVGAESILFDANGDLVAIGSYAPTADGMPDVLTKVMQDQATYTWIQATKY